jgi:hypothetical protein
MVLKSRFFCIKATLEFCIDPISGNKKSGQALAAKKTYPMKNKINELKADTRNLNLIKFLTILGSGLIEDESLE